MSHFGYRENFTQVDTRHDPVYVGTGVSRDGTVSVGLVITPDETVDVHLSPAQAEELCQQIALAASSLRIEESRS